MNRLRRASLAGLLAAPGAIAHAAAFEPVTPAYRLRFPRDHGAHLGHRTEWWYVTGWLRCAGRDLGVQITFFRSRTGHDPANPSRFAPHQLLLAHVALADAAHGRLRHEQRAARAGFADTGIGLADTDLRLGDWTLRRDATDAYRARAPGSELSVDLTLAPPGPPWLQGEEGYSRKGPQTAQASHYYSRPQLRVGGSVRLGSRTLPVDGGVAWLDHEWSSEVLDPRAAGWDWAGINFDDGSSLMAFRIRGRDGSVLWSHARWSGRPRAAAEVRFEPLRTWRSPRSPGIYPVAMRIAIDGRIVTLEPLLDDQELDARASTGGHYWEGAVRVLEAGKPAGRGYLELTGYAAPLRL